MDEQHFFADVDLPFHVWVREGRRWVLRDAGPRLRGDPAARPAGGEGETARRDSSGRR
jgi:hypothetical protein